MTCKHDVHCSCDELQLGMIFAHLQAGLSMKEEKEEEEEEEEEEGGED